MNARPPHAPVADGRAGISRQAFLVHLAGGGLLLSMAGCGGGGDGGGAQASAACTSLGITLNHGHLLSIPAADLDATTARTYSIQGSAPHDHSVTLTPAQLAVLKSGGAVTVTATPGALDGHTHDVGGQCR